jgi:hypothetical protein
MECYTKLEETCMFQNDSSHDDFVEYFYLTRYNQIKGILMDKPEHVRTAAKKAIYDATGKNQYELPLLQDEGKNAMAWSMNWYRMRTAENKPFQLTDDDKANIMSDFEEVRKTAPLKSQLHIFQRNGSDTCLIAVSFIFE